MHCRFNLFFRNSFSRTSLNRCLVAFILLPGLTQLARGEGAACDAATAVSEIADGVFVRPANHHVPFEGTNMASVGFIVGDRCVAVIDSGGSLAEGEALKCAVRSATSQPVCYLILTHHHFDHVMGSKAFAGTTPPVEIIAHENFASALTQSGEYYRTQLADAADRPLPQDHIVLPDRVVATGETRSVDLGGRELLIRALPAAHTNNDLSILDAKTATLWLSDLLFVEHVPALDSSLGSINGWLAELETLGDMAASIAVPGHGPVSVEWPAGKDAMQRYLSTVRNEIRSILAENRSLKDAQDEVGLTEIDKWQMFDYHHRRTVGRAFTELEWE